MRQKLVAGNWKMHGSTAGNQTLLQGVLAGVKDFARVSVAVCPPFPYLAQVATLLAGSSVQLGAQNLSEHTQGAYTGEVSGAMLGELGVSLVLVGHSERRTLFGESDALVAAKFRAAQACGLTPVLCVGETLEEREAGKTDLVVGRQLMAVLDLVGVEALENSVVAYEPVWAIGTGRTAMSDQVQAVHAALRQIVADKGAAVAAKLRILYGGSVKAANAAELFALPDVDGGLIGGASLLADDFVTICRAAQI